MQVANPDEVIAHRPLHCDHCQQSLEGIAGKLKERRQVHDLPEVRLRVCEHQVEEVQCPSCQQLSRGSFPAGVEAPVQYGPNLQALAVYLHQYQLVPLARTCELLSDLCDCALSEGTLTAWMQQAAQTLEPTVERIADWISVSRVQHGDETGIRIDGKLHWIHVNSTPWLTHLAWHAKRGKKALEAIGIWPRFAGRGMHDRFASYDHYPCQHSLCGAHLLRDCLYLWDRTSKSGRWRCMRRPSSGGTRGRRACLPLSGRSGWCAISRFWSQALRHNRHRRPKRFPNGVDARSKVRPRIS